MDIRHEKGIMTIEASISFTAFLFLIVFFLSFGKVYIVQNMVGHAALQSAKNISVSSIYSEAATGSDTVVMADNIDDYFRFIHGILGGKSVTDMIFDDLDTADTEQLVSREFKEVIRAGSSSADCEQYLKWLGVENGFSDIDFKSSKIDSSDITVYVKYKVKFNYPLIGKKHLNLYQNAKVKRFK